MSPQQFCSFSPAYHMNALHSMLTHATIKIGQRTIVASLTLSARIELKRLGVSALIFMRPPGSSGIAEVPPIASQHTEK
jgi:hypothetical protein